MAATGGQLRIDGIDAYSAYGVYVTSGGWGGAVAMPALKKIESNDWQEEDGAEPDLSDPQLDTRDLTLNIAVGDVLDGFPRLIAVLADGAYHAFECAEIGRTLVLRLVSHTALKKAAELGTATLKLADDFPLAGYEYTEPSETLALPSQGGGYRIDGRPLTDYGVRVLKGTEAELVKMPDVKPNLKRSSAGVAGAEYDPETVTFKSRDAKLTMLMTAGTLTEFWRNHDALLYDLTRAGLRTLTSERLGRTWACWYKSMNVTNFTLTHEGGAWMQFALTLTLSKELRDGALGSEDGAMVTTEDGDNGVAVRAERLTRSYQRAFATAMAAGRAAAAQTLTDGDGTQQGDGNTPQTASLTGSPTAAGVDLVKISDLPLITSIAGARTIATDAAGSSVAVPLERITEGVEGEIDAIQTGNEGRDALITSMRERLEELQRSTAVAEHTHPTSEVEGLDGIIADFRASLSELQSGKLDKSEIVYLTTPEVEDMWGESQSGDGTGGSSGVCGCEPMSADEVDRIFDSV